MVEKKYAVHKRKPSNYIASKDSTYHKNNQPRIDISKNNPPRIDIKCITAESAEINMSEENNQINMSEETESQNFLTIDEETESQNIPITSGELESQIISEATNGDVSY